MEKKVKNDDLIQKNKIYASTKNSKFETKFDVV